MKVYAFTKEGNQYMEIENSREAEKQFVGGYPAHIDLTDNLVLVVNDAYLMNALEPRAVLYDDNDMVKHIVCGDCFIYKHDGKGHAIDFSEYDWITWGKKITTLPKKMLQWYFLFFLKGYGYLEQNIHSEVVQEAIEICDREYFQKGVTEEFGMEIKSMLNNSKAKLFKN